MASRQTYDEAQYNGTDNSASYPINSPFQSPRGRGQNNPGWGRVDGLPFVSPRGRGRRVSVQARSQDPNNFGNEAQEEHSGQESRQQLTASDGTSYYSGLVRLDGTEFQSPRGRGRNNPGWGRVDGRPFVSQRGNIAHRGRSAHTYSPSAPTFEDVMDDYN